MGWILFLLVVLLILLLLEKKPQQEEKPQDENVMLPYKKRDDFLSFSELSFYCALKTFVENKATICPKVAIKEVIFVDNSIKEGRRKFSNWISQKHVDFVLCHASTMQVICAVELDDKSHNKENRKQRDELVDQVFATAKIPLFHIIAKNGYSVDDFKSILDCFLEQNDTNVGVSEQTIDVVEINQTDDAPMCPKCGVKMVKRKAKQGAKTGENFYGCPNYPNCREIKRI